jgi:hypothetical protein
LQSKSLCHARWSNLGFCHQEAAQENAQAQAQEDAEKDPLAATGARMSIFRLLRRSLQR